MFLPFAQNWEAKVTSTLKLYGSIRTLWKVKNEQWRQRVTQVQSWAQCTTLLLVQPYCPSHHTYIYLSRVYHKDTHQSNQSIIQVHIYINIKSLNNTCSHIHIYIYIILQKHWIIYFYKKSNISLSALLGYRVY